MTDVKNAPASDGVEPVWDQSQPAWDEPQPRGASGWLRGISGTDRLHHLAVAGVSLLIGLVNALSIAQDVTLAWRGLRPPDTAVLGDVEHRDDHSACAGAVHRRPPSAPRVRLAPCASRWPRPQSSYSRPCTLPAWSASANSSCGLPAVSYDFHLSAATVIYEFRKDVVTCLLIGGTLWLIDSRRQTRPVAIARAARRDGHGTASGLASAMARPASASNPGNHLDQFGRRLRRVQPRRRHAVTWCVERWRRPELPNSGGIIWRAFIAPGSPISIG